MAELQEIIEGGWSVEASPLSEIEQRLQAAPVLPIVHSPRLVPLCHLQHQRKASSNLDVRQQTFIRAWLEARFQPTPLPGMVAPCHVEASPGVEWGTMSTEWSAVAFGLLFPPQADQEFLLPDPSRA